MRNVTKVGAWIAAAALSVGLPGSTAPASATVGGGPAAFRDHTSLVPQTPATGYPVISSLPRLTRGDCAKASCPRQVFGADQVGRYIVAGGNFANVELQDGRTISQPYFTAWNIDSRQLVCAGLRFDDEVLAVEPGPAADLVYVGGRFTTITTADGAVLKRGRVALIKLSDCSVVRTFVSQGANNKVDELVLVGGRLFVGGDFSTIGAQPVGTLAQLDAATGKVNPAFAFSFSVTTPSRVLGLAANPAGTRLVLGGRFGTIAGAGGSVPAPTAVIDISNPAAAQLTAHRSSGYTIAQGGLADLQDIGISPDGTAIGLAFGTATRSDYVFLTAATDAAVTPRWNHSMRDSSFGVAVSNNAVYVGGHFCKPAGGPGAAELMAPRAGIASDCTGTSTGWPTAGVWRSKLAALSLTDGTPLAWNPGNASYRGASELTVTSRGLLVGYDGERTSGIRTGALAFLDLGGALDDQTAPSPVTFTAPAAGGTVGNPVRISGSATDDIGLAGYRVVVRATGGLYLQADGTLGSARYQFVKPATAAAGFELDVAPAAGSYTATGWAVDGAGLVSATVTAVSFVVPATTAA